MNLRNPAPSSPAQKEAHPVFSGYHRNPATEAPEHLTGETSFSGYLFVWLLAYHWPALLTADSILLHQFVFLPVTKKVLRLEGLYWKFAPRTTYTPVRLNDRHFEKKKKIQKNWRKKIQNFQNLALVKNAHIFVNNERIFESFGALDSWGCQLSRNIVFGEKILYFCDPYFPLGSSGNKWVYRIY